METLNLSQVLNYINECSQSEVNAIIKEVNARQRKKIADAKAQFKIGDKVTSDHFNWIYGVGEIVKINRKRIVVATNTGNVSATATMLKHAEI